MQFLSKNKFLPTEIKPRAHETTTALKPIGDKPLMKMWHKCVVDEDLSYAFLCINLNMKDWSYRVKNQLMMDLFIKLIKDSLSCITFEVIFFLTLSSVMVWEDDITSFLQGKKLIFPAQIQSWKINWCCKFKAIEKNLGCFIRNLEEFVLLSNVLTSWGMSMSNLLIFICQFVLNYSPFAIFLISNLVWHCIKEKMERDLNKIGIEEQVQLSSLYEGYYGGVKRLKTWKRFLLLFSKSSLALCVMR